jgi:hypothetical protein
MVVFLFQCHSLLTLLLFCIYLSLFSDQSLTPWTNLSQCLVVRVPANLGRLNGRPRAKPNRSPPKSRMSEGRVNFKIGMVRRFHVVLTTTLNPVASRLGWFLKSPPKRLGPDDVSKSVSRRLWIILKPFGCLHPSRLAGANVWAPWRRLPFNWFETPSRRSTQLFSRCPGAPVV